ncbi:TetR/AcrR family transcriptional regulator [Paenibacillus sp. MMS18-CY102]|uniref:TetR/AcrR family transcriptional regulator n=1 Tax=Paenibacillus sp. MMS18-CY102 TaxID=2682849 RepID=UPI001365AD5B|nr:TetR/AcrR family transcriptional regulator [Paenibacillus sp. MMS18-CY102]MWC30674.1 TetR family transcriptional regulator [Paenibacillus sp. MMS18-CY102]
MDSDIKLKILQAAKNRFASQGFDGTTVRQICEDAGANQALVSYYFGGKESMFFTMFDTFFPAGLYSKYLEENYSPEEGIRRMVKEVIAYRMREPKMVQIIQQEILLDTIRTARIREYVSESWMQLREWLREGKEQGVFHYQSLDTAFMSTLGVILFQRICSFWQPFLTGDVGELEQLTEEVVSFVLRGLRPSIDE